MFEKNFVNVEITIRGGSTEKNLKYYKSKFLQIILFKYILEYLYILNFFFLCQYKTISD